MHPPLVPLERLPSLICTSVAWQSLLLTSYLSYDFLSPMIVLIDVSLSHLFVFLLYHISLFAILSVNSCAYAHPLHECSKYRKGVDQIDLYLASGLGTSQDKIPKKTKCETLVDRVLNTKILFLVFPIPLLARKHHLETFESRTTRALAPNVLLLLVSMLI